MVRTFAIVSVATLAPTAFAITANPAFNGTWKSNPARSQLTGRTISYSKEGSGFRYTAGYINYVFGCDGRDYPLHIGSDTTVCKQTGPNTYQRLQKTAGKVTSRIDVSIAPDGRSYTSKYVDYDPDGQQRTGSATFDRIAGNPSDGLIGTWKSVKREATPFTLTYKFTGDHVLLTYPSDKETIDAKLDGTPASPKGPDVSGNYQSAITLLSPNKVHIAEMLNGKPIYDVTDTLSADGKTLTSVAYTVGTEDEKTTQIFEKQ